MRKKQRNLRGAAGPNGLEVVVGGVHALLHLALGVLRHARHLALHRHGHASIGVVGRTVLGRTDTCPSPHVMMLEPTSFPPSGKPKKHTYLLDRQLVAGLPTTFMTRGTKKACVLATRPRTRRQARMVAVEGGREGGGGEAICECVFCMRWTGPRLTR